MNIYLVMNTVKHDWKLRKASERHSKKLAVLQRETTSYERNEIDLQNTVINLSRYTLNDAEYRALSFGMNMCWPQPKVNALQAKADTEYFFRQLCERATISDSDIDWKQWILGTFSKYVRQKVHIPPELKEMFVSLNKLKRNSEIYISKFDKGNGVGSHESK